MFVDVLPPAMLATAGDLFGTSAGTMASIAAAGGIHAATLPPASEEVSAASVMVHGAVAGEFQASAAAGWALFQLFLTTLGVSAGSYTATEAANIPTLL
jgi:hypothetical protein